MEVGGSVNKVGQSVKKLREMGDNRNHWKVVSGTGGRLKRSVA